MQESQPKIDTSEPGSEEGSLRLEGEPWPFGEAGWPLCQGSPETDTWEILLRPG